MAVVADIAGSLAALAGAASVRHAQADDAVDGVQPAVIVEPGTAETVAAVLAWCSAQRHSLVVRGGGTKLEWGRRASSIDVLLSTRGLNQVLRYEPGDLTVTVEAGVPVARLNEVMGAYRQYLPVDTRNADTTVGGTLATNECGPLRHRYGAPRDQVIGVRIATPDGRLASAGGHVVKNVAGYDLGKTMAGSFGSLAAIVSATFKLAPVPSSTSTLTIDYADVEAAAGASAVIAGSQIDPLAVEIDARFLSTHGGVTSSSRLSVRVGGVVDVVAAHLDEAATMTSPFAATRVARLMGGDDRAWWERYAESTWAAPGALVKCSWMPASLEQVLRLLRELVQADIHEIELRGRAADGTGIVRLAGTSDGVGRAVSRLRAQPAVVGNIVVVRADGDVKARVDVWGMPSGAAKLGGALKRTFDPAGVMNAGRGPL